MEIINDSNKSAKGKKVIVALVLGLALVIGLGVYFLDGGAVLQGKSAIVKQAKATFNGKEVKLSWPEIANAVKYDILRSEKSGQWKDKTWINSRGGNSYGDSLIEKDKVYFYNIVATNAKYSKVWVSNEVKVATPAQKGTISTPKLSFVDNSTETFLQVVGETSVEIKWNAVPGAAQYQVVEKRVVGAGVFSTQTMNTAYTRKIMPWEAYPDQKGYTYTVRAMGKDGSVSADSNQVKVTILPPIDIYFPWIYDYESVVEKYGEPALKVEWQFEDSNYQLPNGVEITSYDLYRDGELVENVEFHNEGFIDKNVDVDKLYEYRVVANLKLADKSIEFDKNIELESVKIEPTDGQTKICPEGTTISVSPVEISCLDGNEGMESSMEGL